MMPDWTPDGSTVNSYASYDTTDNVIMDGTCKQSPYFNRVDYADYTDGTDAKFLWFETVMLITDWFSE